MMDELSPKEYLEIIRQASSSESPNLVMYGYIESGYSSGRPRIKPAGADRVIDKKYPYLSSYTPKSNDYVMILNGVIMGRVI